MESDCCQIRVVQEIVVNVDQGPRHLSHAGWDWEHGITVQLYVSPTSVDINSDEQSYPIIIVEWNRFYSYNYFVGTLLLLCYGNYDSSREQEGPESGWAGKATKREDIWQSRWETPPQVWKWQERYVLALVLHHAELTQNWWMSRQKSRLVPRTLELMRQIRIQVHLKTTMLLRWTFASKTWKFIWSAFWPLLAKRFGHWR